MKYAVGLSNARSEAVMRPWVEGESTRWIETMSEHLSRCSLLGEWVTPGTAEAREGVRLGDQARIFIWKSFAI